MSKKFRTNIAKETLNQNPQGNDHKESPRNEGEQEHFIVVPKLYCGIKLDLKL